MTEDEVRHVAMLARLGLTDEEVQKMRHQLSTVLEHVAMLQKLDTSKIEPTAQMLERFNVMRNDQPRPSLPVKAVLSNAPDTEGDLFRVPAVLEEFRGVEEGTGDGEHKQ